LLLLDEDSRFFGSDVLVPHVGGIGASHGLNVGKEARLALEVTGDDRKVLTSFVDDLLGADCLPRSGLVFAYAPGNP
jgi:hypothetical protein